MCGVHSKVFSAVCRVHAKEDQRFADRCRQLRGRLTPRTVGVHSDYQCPYRHTISHLNRLEELPAPLEQLYCLQDAIVSQFSIPRSKSKRESVRKLVTASCFMLLSFCGEVEGSWTRVCNLNALSLFSLPRKVSSWMRRSISQTL